MSKAIEIICQYHGTRSFGNRENMIAQTKNVGSIYRQLNQDEIHQLIEIACEDNERGDALLTCLACLHPGSLKPFHQQMVDHEFFRPGLIYHEADDSVSSQFAEMIEASGDRLNRNHLLLCMAWAGNNAVQNQFAQWRSAPPAWVNEMYVPPHSYANEAGWELTADGSRRDLFFQTALPLIASNQSTEADPCVGVGIPSEKTCPWCRRSLVSMLTLDLKSSLLGFFGSRGEHAETLTCDVCTAYGIVFGKLDEKGSGSWHQKNKEPEYLPGDLDDWGAFPERPLVLSGNSRRHFMESACWATVPDVSFSQVGGLPTWVQDAEYPECPDCSHRMMFIGQISNEDFDRNMEGLFYMFLCDDCGSTATHYQQT